MKHLISLSLCIAFSFASLPAQSFNWTTPEQAWPESFGSQRAVLEIGKAVPCAEISLTWRRHDRNPDKRRFLIINAATGDTVKNVSRLVVNPEKCTILTGPINNPGTYYFYYLPFAVAEGWGWYGRDYLKPEAAPDAQWIAQYPAAKALKAKVSRIESRTPFDNFFPMEIIPTSEEKSALLKKHTDPALYFTESREFPIRMKDEIPWRWVQSGPSSLFTGVAMKNEYYAFQVGVFASTGEITELTVLPGNLVMSGKLSGQEIRMTCFNTDGIDPYGVQFSKKLTIPAGRVQPLWIGADVPRNAQPGKYTGRIMITGKNIPVKEISVTLVINDQVLDDRGDSEPWRHSRLRWLNSTAGSEGTPVPPYSPVTHPAENQLSVAGHTLQIGKNGLPEIIQNQEKNLLASPVSLNVVTAEGPVNFEISDRQETLNDGKYTLNAVSSASGLAGKWQMKAEYDGYLKTQVTFRNDSKTALSLLDIRLSIPMDAGTAKYMMGMGLPGCAVPPSHESKWKGPFDSFWIGDAQGGIWCELRGSTYSGPMLNLYHPAPPESWNNGGKGGFRITRAPGNVTAEVYSGDRILNPGDSIVFEWALLITPVKKINPVSQFTDRYYHTGEKPTPEQKDFDAGVKIVNIHHANEYNPFINYPFIAVKEMRAIIDDLHSKGIKAKIYYTVRELTNHVTEVWALRSLGYEILDNGNGGGYPWLREHFVEGYTPQWYQHFPDGRVDASVLSAPGDSRWLNYYIEGLAWLVKNVNIDGLYLDDVTYDRRILQRMRTVMAQPGCMIDLHSNTGFSIGPATQYTEFFPYVDKVWFGESFQYDRMSAENWLVEVSGIPFGLMGDMLQGGGNRWLGMVFGMTVRYPWTTEGVLCDPKPVWKIWDEFQISDAKMTGFWDQDCPLKTDVPEIKATAYIKPGKTLLSIGNFSDRTQYVNLNIDWKALGLDPAKCTARAPAVENFQSAKVFDINSPIPVEPRKGWLIFIENR